MNYLCFRYEGLVTPSYPSTITYISNYDQTFNNESNQRPAVGLLSLINKGKEIVRKRVAELGEFVKVFC